MEDELNKETANANFLAEPGVSVFHSKTGDAFMLIAFLVGDLIFINKIITPPVNPSVYDGLNETSFSSLKNKILDDRNERELTHLTLRESISLYMLIDVVCKCFVDDENEKLKALAVENVKIEEEEYNILRINFLRYGQSLIKKMNEKFSRNKIFSQALSKVKNPGKNT